jgi:hypothetical protein
VNAALRGEADETAAGLVPRGCRHDVDRVVQCLDQALER